MRVENEVRNAILAKLDPKKETTQVEEVVVKIKKTSKK